MVFLCGLAGCDRGVIDTPLDTKAYPYAPRSNGDLGGAVGVGKFEYIRADNISDREVVFESIGGFTGKFDVPIGELFSDAVRREFRSSGIKVVNAGCQISGEIQKLYATRTVTSSTFTSDVRFVLSDRNGTMLLDKTYASVSTEGHFSFNSEDIFSRRVYAVFGQNIAQLIDDADFRSALAGSCS